MSGTAGSTLPADESPTRPAVGPRARRPLGVLRPWDRSRRLRWAVSAAVPKVKPSGGQPEIDDGGRRSIGQFARRIVTAPSVTDGLTILVSWNFAIAQPVLDVLGRNSPFFVAHWAESADVVLLGLGLTLVAPLGLALVVGGLTRLSRPLGRVAHSLILGVLAALFAWQVVKRIGVPPSVALGLLMLAVGAGVVAVYRRSAAIRSFARWLSPAPLVFLVLFLFFSPVSAVVRSAGAVPVSTARAQNPVPVVMVVFDEFPVISLMDPGGALDERAFPNFARLAETSTWYRNTTTVSDYTIKAVPAILDGRKPRPGVVLPTAEEHPRNLFTLLGASYDVDAYQFVTDLCPPQVCPSMRTPWWPRTKALFKDAGVIAGHVVLPPALKSDLPPLGENWGVFGDSGALSTTSPAEAFNEFLGSGRPPNVTDRANLIQARPEEAVRAFASKFEPGARPTFHFLHLSMPHEKWRYLPSGQYYDPGPVSPMQDADLGWSSDRFAEIGRDRHLLQVGYTDRLLGLVLDQLLKRDLFDDALIVVTADHGVAFDSSHHPRWATPATEGSIAWVPLFIKAPGQRAGRVDDRPAETIDVLPTVADVVGVPSGDDDGRSLLSAPEVSRSRLLWPGGGGRPLPLASDPKARDAALAEEVAQTGDPDDPHRWFRSGPFGSVVGTRVSGRPSSIAATLDGRDLFRDLDPRAPALPVWVGGTLSAPGGKLADGTEVAVSINGVVAGVGPAYAVRDGKARFQVLLDPSTFRKGRNALQVLVAASRTAPTSWDRAALPA